MLAYHVIDPYLGVEKGNIDSEMAVLRHLLHISTWDSVKFQVEPEIFFSDKKE